MKNFVYLGLLLLSLNILAESNRWQGQPFAEFSLQDQAGKLRTNQEFSGKWAVVYFYPKDRTPGCTVEAQNFVKDFANFQSMNVEIIGVSYDDVESHLDFYNTYEMKFTLLADVDHSLSKAMDVDRFLPWPHPSRQTFIVNPEGVIAKHYEDVDPDTHSATLLKDLKVLQGKKG